MHASVSAWVASTVTQADIAGKSVLEVGAYDVNGSVRPHVETLDPAEYIGVDQTLGPRVDLAVPAEDLTRRFGESSFDVVLSFEMLEHAADWRTCLTNMAGVLADGGLLVLTTRSPGFPYHPFPDDHWRFTPEVMRKILDELGLRAEVVEDPDPKRPGVFVRAIKPPNSSPGLITVEAERVR